METVSILMAVYKPNINFFIEQLKSINNQDYENLKVFIVDDSDDISWHNNIVEIVEQNLTRKTFEIFKNQENLGSNRSFELLTRISTGRYYAYCDQDDIWENNKISKLVKLIKDENALIAYSDLSIIDKSNNNIARSLKDISKRLVHHHGDKLYKIFLRRNSITGCTMLIDSKVARESLPFPEHNEYIHDHWLALFASCNGKIAYTSEPLVKYRIHANNQIGAKLLDGIEDKKKYVDIKIKNEEEKINYLLKRNIQLINNDISKEVEDYLIFVKRRKAYLCHFNFKNLIGLLKEGHKDISLIIFEFMLGVMPNRFTKYLISTVKK